MSTKVTVTSCHDTRLRTTYRDFTSSRAKSESLLPYVSFPNTHYTHKAQAYLLSRPSPLSSIRDSESDECTTGDPCSLSDNTIASAGHWTVELQRSRAYLITQAISTEALEIKGTPPSVCAPTDTPSAMTQQISDSHKKNSQCANENFSSLSCIIFCTHWRV